VERLTYIFNIALEAVFLNKFRSFLTALGIIFGVAAVIAMLAIGNGARQEILDQMKLVGVNNIIIVPKSTDDQKSESENNGSSSSTNISKKFSPGLTLKDANSIKSMIPSVQDASPEVIYETDVIKDGIRKTAKISGVTPDYFNIFNLTLREGEMFNQDQLRDGKPVCILGSSIKSKLFPSENPLGKHIKIGHVWLKVVGVLEKRKVNEGATENLGISNYNEAIFAPVQTILLRFKDRSVVTSSSLSGGSMFVGGGFAFFRSESGGGLESNQVDKIVVQVKETEKLSVTADVIKRMLQRRHAGLEDFEIKIPELLLKQQQRTKDIFNIVLGAIAGISLLVGGIGIMNIMLASVLERTKEIGIRLAIGARKKDIITQFLAEATMISLTGGTIGILLGIALAMIIKELADILTIVSPSSIILSFFVSATVGILFGFMPARKAAHQDPVTSLRYE